MFNRQSIIYLLLSLALIALSGSFLTAFQGWVQQQSQASKSLGGLPVNVSGIRQIISSNSPSVAQSENEQKLLTAPDQRDISKAHLISQPLGLKVSAPQNFGMNGLNDITKQDIAFTDNLAANANPTHLQPTLVVFENEWVLEFPKAIASKQNIKKAVSRILLSQAPFQEFDLLSNEKINAQQRPFLYQHVLNQKGQAIRYPKQAYRYADYLMAAQSQEVEDEEGRFLLVHIPMVDVGLKGPAKNYQAWVNNYSAEFNVSPALIYAVMETESAFDPKAVSKSKAIGLMQLKPETAGKDVYQLVDGRMGKPSVNELFNAQNNIRMGSAYLSLLYHEYLSDIKDEKIKKMLAISSYNGGMSTVLKLFGKTPKQAIDRVNRLKPNQVYRKLRFGHQSDETRRYLDKVLKAETKYQKLLSVKDRNV